MSRFILHIGLPKTGTASLRLSVFSDHPQIFYLGQDRHANFPQGCVSEEIATALKPVLWPGTAFPVRAKKLEPARHLLARLPDGKRVTVGSWEGLGTLEPRPFDRILKNLKAVKKDCGMLICLRNASDWLPSLYLQETRGHFRHRNRTRTFRSNAYLPIEAWLANSSRRAGGLRKWLCHVRNIHTAVKLLGKENVQLLMFEELRSEPQTHYRKIARFLDVDDAETLRLGVGVHENTRLCQAEYAYIQAAQETSGSRREWRRQDLKTIKVNLEQLFAENPDSPPVRVRLDAGWRARVDRLMRPQYQWLQDTFELNLAARGYPVDHPGANG